MCSRQTLPAGLITIMRCTLCTQCCTKNTVQQISCRVQQQIGNCVVVILFAVQRHSIHIQLEVYKV